MKHSTFFRWLALACMIIAIAGVLAHRWVGAAFEAILSLLFIGISFELQRNNN